MSPAPPRILGRYALFEEIAAGGMATVHLGRLVGSAGFARTVAVKRLHAHVAQDPDFVSMFLDEARLAGRIQHPNVVATLDVVQDGEELFLVMEYILGETVAWLARAAAEAGTRVPVDVATTIVAGALYGLHAAHEATNEHGEPLEIVHRDVSPQNVIVGRDGVARVLDFGVAKAAARVTSTRGNAAKGKLRYMAPEQIRGAAERRSDVYAAGVVLWELLTGKRLFDGENDAVTVMTILEGCGTPPSHVASDVPVALDDIVLRSLALDPNDRFPTARAMAVALERAVRPATPREVGEWLDRVSGPRLRDREKRVAEVESVSASLAVRGSLPSLARTGDVPVTRPAAVAPIAVEGSTEAGISAPAGEVRSRRKVAIVAIASSAAIVLVGGVALLTMGGRRPASAETGSDAADAKVAVTPSSLSASVSAPSTPSASSPPVASSASATASAAPPPLVVRPPKGLPTTAPPKAGGNCNPPYVIDTAGVKRYKAECL